MDVNHLAERLSCFVHYGPTYVMLVHVIQCGSVVHDSPSAHVVSSTDEGLLCVGSVNLLSIINKPAVACSDFHHLLLQRNQFLQ